MLNVKASKIQFPTRLGFRKKKTFRIQLQCFLFSFSLSSNPQSNCGGWLSDCEREYFIERERLKKTRERVRKKEGEAMDMVHACCGFERPEVLAYTRVHGMHVP